MKNKTQKLKDKFDTLDCDLNRLVIDKSECKKTIEEIELLLTKIKKEL